VLSPVPVGSPHDPLEQYDAVRGIDVSVAEQDLVRVRALLPTSSAASMAPGSTSTR
jgi:hypothetical protein